MQIKQVLVVKESRAGETRVALTPKTISFLSSRKYRLLVETGAGLKAGFADSDYVKAGAEIFYPMGRFPEDTLLLRVKRADEERERLENQLFSKNTAMMGFLDPLSAGDHVTGWQNAGITTFSVDSFKSLSVDDPKNMQAAMSRIAGRLAFRAGLEHNRSEKPLKLSVIGTGPAALSATLEARKSGIPVQVFGRGECYRKEFESIGAVYHILPADQVTHIRNYLKDETIVITAARVPRVRAPLLIDEESLRTLPKGAVIIDLTVNEGGSVVGAKSDQVVLSNGISIAHVSGYPKKEPRASSEAYATCLAHLLTEVISPEGEIRLEHPLLQECWVTHEKNVNLDLLQ